MKSLFRCLKISTLAIVLLAQCAVYISPISVSAQIDISKPAPTSLPVYNAGVDKTIEEYLCTPTGKGTDLFDCVGKLYRFSITFGAIVLVFFVVMAGYLYITGGEKGKGSAKNILTTASAGMGLMLISYVLLNFINPELVKIKIIQPPIFSSVDLPDCAAIGFGSNCIISSGPNAGQVFSGSAGPRGKACALMTGNCSPENLEKAGCSTEVAKGMSILCSVESSNDPTIYSRSDICTDSSGKEREITLTSNPALPANIRGKTIPMSASWGLFQFNLTIHNIGGNNCPSAFEGTFTGNSKDCKVKDPLLYEKCIIAATDVGSHLKKACQLAQKGYSDWTCSAWKCGISQNVSNCASAYGIKQVVRYKNPLLGN